MKTNLEMIITYDVKNVIKKMKIKMKATQSC